MKLAGKVGIVTGASRGMGRHFVAALVAAGARVGCLARESDELASLATEFGEKVMLLAGSVTDAALVNGHVAVVVARFGKLDFLVNNAAIFHPFRLEDASDAQVEQHIAINLIGPAWCMRAAIPHLRRTKGNLVAISSESVRMPYPFLGIYAATKAGLETLTAAMRDELRADGIRVTTLRSGAVAGGSGDKDWDPLVRDAFFGTSARTGHAAFAGTPADPASMARALVDLLALPPDINVDLIEIRAAAAENPGA
jgi:NAD(P)-dependent dehydrogenase (short-subunit alcohol dehydrogenase family)